MAAIVEVERSQPLVLSNFVEKRKRLIQRHYIIKFPVYN